MFKKEVLNSSRETMNYRSTVQCYGEKDNALSSCEIIGKLARED
ncbi:MAG: hypothetical protein ACYSR1_09765 [Planctomycetota bacterium]|jgi:hypothetical protein